MDCKQSHNVFLVHFLKIIARSRKKGEGKHNPGVIEVNKSQNRKAIGPRRIFSCRFRVRLASALWAVQEIVIPVFLGSKAEGATGYSIPASLSSPHPFHPSLSFLSAKPCLV